jgi:hypothetical protein
MAQADSNYTTKLSSSIRDPLTKSTHESITGDRGGMSSVTRRLAMNMIVAAAAASTLVPRAAVTSEADPIHKAIAAHVAGLAALEAGIDVLYALEAELPKELRRSNVCFYEEVIVETDDARWIECQKNLHALHEADQEAALGLINVEPTTLAGLLALMRHVTAYEARGNNWPSGLQEDDGPPAKLGKDWEVFLHRNIAQLLSASIAA